MQITAKVSGSIKDLLDAEQATLADQLRAGMAVAAQAVQDDLRGQVRAAGLGLGLEKAWQRAFYPNNDRPLQPGALVYSKSTPLHRVFIEGATITAGSSRYLAIPTREAEALGFATSNVGRGGAATGSIPRHASQVEAAIAKLGAANCRFVPGKKGQRLLVYTVPQGRGRGVSLRRGVLGAKRGQQIVLFILAPSVRLNARLDFAGAQGRADATLAAAIGAALGRGA